MSRKFPQYRQMQRCVGTIGMITAMACGIETALAADFLEPPVFTSQNGVLNILMVAKAKPIPTISFTPPTGGSAINPIGWAYEICQRPATGSSCPTGTGTVWDYGGVRLALQQGDTLNIHFVNQLPKVDANKLNHVTDPGEANLFLNPTNLHTHGLLTPARAATSGDQTFGDYIFVNVYNSAKGRPVPQTPHRHVPIAMDRIDYQIPVPSNHPSGLLWYHPHSHGIALNQVVQGMAGLITIGNVGSYAKGDVGNAPIPNTNVRHIMLKEIQVLAQGTVNFDSGPQAVADGEVLDQEDPAFCAPDPARGEVRQGSCPGVDNGPDGSNFTGGKWFFTVNGIQYPTIPITDPDGEIWRIGTAAGSLPYDLQPIHDVNNSPTLMALFSV